MCIRQKDPSHSYVMNTLDFSELLYYSNVWANCSKLNIDKLQSVQIFACKGVS